MGVGGQLHAPAASTLGKDPVPIVQEAVDTVIRQVLIANARMVTRRI